MTKNEYNGLTALAAVRAKLDADSYLEVIQEGGYCWKAHFTFGDPATVEAVEEVKKQLKEQFYLPLPPAYEQFLLHYNGALLYYDDIYGQWGFRLYGTSELISKNTLWRSLYDGWSPDYLVFAECLGDSDLLLLDTKQRSNLTGESYVLDGDTGYPVKTWRVIARSFGDWLDRLVVVQGAKYWRWY